MNKDNIMLTIEEIHKIREEHYEQTKNLSYEEYHNDMKREIAPILARLEELRAQKLQSN